MVEEVEADKKIQRALWISQVNGWSIAGVAGLSALVVILFGQVFGFLVGIAVAVGGLMELRGGRLLSNGSAVGIRWLAASQVYLMAVLWSYAGYSLTQFDKSDPWARFSPHFKDFVLKINPDVYLVELMLEFSYYATYISLIIAVLIYQGGLCLYYLSRKKYLYVERE